MRKRREEGVKTEGVASEEVEEVRDARLPFLLYFFTRPNLLYLLAIPLSSKSERREE